MVGAFLTGFLLGISLILAIGAQNAFVLRQGIIKHHIFYVALFCAFSDALLICLGVAGLSFFFGNFINEFSNYIFGLSSIWLATYGLIRLIAAFRSDSKIKIEASSPRKLLPTISVLALITFANPHVYLDTLVLIGSISQKYTGMLKIAFTIGASLASFVFFFTLAYGARFLTPIMQKSLSWRVLDFLIALVMFFIAIRLAYEGNWI